MHPVIEEMDRLILQNRRTDFPAAMLRRWADELVKDVQPKLDSLEKRKSKEAQ